MPHDKSGKMKKFAMLSVTLLMISCQSNVRNDDFRADVIIYGGTSAAVTAAVQVAKSGYHVIVVSPDVHLGGLTSGGLGWTDTGDKSVIGGLARTFYHKVYQHYQSDKAWKWQSKEAYGNRGQGSQAMDGSQRTMWIFEPHVAAQIFEDWVAEQHIQVFRDEWLDRQFGVEMENNALKSMKTLSGKTFIGEIFIDATYEGDLMAAAGVSYTVGRESNSRYQEHWNGVQTGIFHHGHYFKEKIDPYLEPGNPASGILPRISTEPPGDYGSGDNRIQAYCFRMCLTNVPDNRVPFTRPKNYDPAQYGLLARVFESGWREVFRKFDPIPNNKTDTNNHGPFSTDNIGMNYDYPEASYARRRAIIQEHEDYQKGLMYYLSHDAGVPSEVREEMVNWGLAADEFEDNDNWPHQIYVREARRMIGEYIMTEHEILGEIPVKRSIGMGSYTMDSHNVQRYITAEGYVQNEGDVGVHPPKPYKIALGAILPKRSACNNLLVPVAVSSSHIAYGSIRMEPVFMILGQSAATLAVLALKKSLKIHEVSYQDMKQQLLSDGQVLELESE